MFRKIVDQSVLKEGFTVPQDYWQTMLRATNSSLSKGEKKQIHILIDGSVYEAELTNVNLAGNNERLQVRYTKNEPIAVKLCRIFSKTQAYVKNAKEQAPGKKQMLRLPTGEEYFDIYPMTNGYLKFVCVSANPYEDKSVKDVVEIVKTYIQDKGFSYTEGMIENFYLSLKSKPFVILAGISGTGKTRLVKLFAEALGATVENGRYKLAAVRPDWSDTSDLFGHMDLNGHFVAGDILDFIEQAEEDRTHPYFLCLDEMNLARVEYYLSDVLSVMETREKDNTDIITTIPLVSEMDYGRDEQAIARYGQAVRMPENLYLIGTVNMDETTFPFSRKVLDRANTIEFSMVNLVPDFVETAENTLPLTINNIFLKPSYLILKDCQADAEFVNEVCLELQEINRILQIANAHVGYRVRDEIVFYMLNNKKENLIPQAEAMDYELMQKILPRIQGSSMTVKNMLCEMFKHCAGDYDGYQIDADDVSAKMLTVIKKTECKYRQSAEKIAFMVRRYEEDGFTSYWL